LTRDLTLNQVLATDDELQMTEACLLDTFRRIFRPTKHELGKFPGRSRTGIGPKMMAKMIRFYADSIEKYDRAELVGLDDWLVEPSFISPFWLAVHLDRAFENGYQSAMAYVRELKKLDQIPDEIDTPEEAAVYLVDLMDDESFYYRNAPIDQYKKEDELIDFDEYDKLPIQLSHRRSS